MNKQGLSEIWLEAPESRTYHPRNEDWVRQTIESLEWAIKPNNVEDCFDTWYNLHSQSQWVIEFCACSS